MVVSRRTGRLKWRRAVAAGALSILTSVAATDGASAQGFFDFLFGGAQQQRQAPQPNYPPPSPEIGRVAPAPLGSESVNENGGSTGHAVAFCVRLCDGLHFPMEQMVNGTPVETCRAICPYSKTKVFMGSEIGEAVAQDGQHYAALDTAFIYRKHLVANCTCNGREPYGLPTFDVRNDPTLRPGDIVSTKDGLLAYTGRSQQGAAFTPVNPSTLPPDIRPGSSQLRLPQTVEPSDDEEGGTIVQSDKRQPPVNPAAASPAVRQPAAPGSPPPANRQPAVPR